MTTKLPTPEAGPPLDKLTSVATGADKKKIQLQLEKTQKLLDGAVSLLKSRSKASQQLLTTCNQLIGTLEALNNGHTKDFLQNLFELVELALSRIVELDKQFANNKNPARARLWKLYTELQERLEEKETPAYSPLTMPELTKSIESAFSGNAPVCLSKVLPFPGSGVYALYYTGDFPLYKPIADSNKQTPGSWAIYVGKAGKEGRRKGTDLKSSKYAIYERLANHHTESIKATALNVEDFWVRYLPIEGLFVPLCEKMLIAQHQPLWNDVVDGFGNKHMGVARIHKETGQQITPWDLLHPGRGNRAVKLNKRFPKIETLESVVKKAVEKAQKERPTLSVAISEAIEKTESEGESEDN
jgi:hypothetical protein